MNLHKPKRNNDDLRRLVLKMIKKRFSEVLLLKKIPTRTSRIGTIVPLRKNILQQFNFIES